GGGRIGPDDAQANPDDGKVRVRWMDRRFPDAREEEAKTYPAGCERVRGTGVGEPPLAVMRRRARHGIADTAAGAQGEGERQERGGSPDQLASSPAGSSRRNDAPPSG